jgi:hypothetical protein
MSADKMEDPFMAKSRNQHLLAKRTLPEALRGAPTSIAHRFTSAKYWRDGEWTETPVNLLENYLKEIPGGYGTTKSLWTLLLEVADFYPAIRNMHRVQPMVAVPPSGGNNKFRLVKDPDSKGSQVMPNVHPVGETSSGGLPYLRKLAGRSVW